MSVYAIVWAYQQQIPNAGQKFTLVTAAQYCNDQGVCWVSQKSLAEDMSMTDRTVRTHLDQLQSAGYIQRHERRRKDGTRTTDLIQLMGFDQRKNFPVAEPSTGKKRQEQPENISGHETSIGNVTSNSPNGEDGKPSPGQFVGYLREELDGTDVPLLRNREDRYAAEFNKLLKKDIGDDILYKVCDRIVERWKDDEHRKLTAEQALEDVVNGKPPRHAAVRSIGPTPNGTPPEVIDYVFANAAGEAIRNGESRLRSVMGRFDFTSGAQPPWPIQKELGGTDNERWSVLDGLHALCRRAQREIDGVA